MKKLFVILLIMFFSVLPCFAKYKPIPKNLSKQYKAEVTQIIDTQYPVAVHETEQLRTEAHKMYLEVLKNKNLYMNYCASNFDMTIDTPEFEIASKIIDITNNYVSIRGDESLCTGYTGSLLDFLDPYFKDNKIDDSKLKSLSALSNIRYKEIIKEQEDLHRFMYPEEY